MRSSSAVRLCALIVAMALSGCASYWLLYPEMAESTDPHLDPAAAGNQYELISVTNANRVSLKGWLFAKPGDHGTTLILGGNAMNISATYAQSRYLIGNGFRVLIFTWQGFDSNGGKAELASLLGDANAFYAYAQSRYPGDPIAFVGYSTGAVTGVCLGAKVPLKAIAVEGTFNPKTIVDDRHMWFVKPLEGKFVAEIPDDLDTARCLNEIKTTPVLFVHNRDDTLAPYDAARRLYDGYRGPKEFFDTKELDSSHAHMGSAFDEQAQTKILAFLKQNLS
jgi:predicted alpha/beta hydrolase